MKKLIFISASTIALSMAGTALAQTAPADPLSPTADPATPDCDGVVGNCSLGEQDGTGLSITVTQSNTGNVSDIDQVGGASQTGATATVTQSGSDNDSYVLQDSTGIGGFPSRVTVNQTGVGADSTVRQDGTRNFSAFVNQADGANSAYLQQDGFGQTRLDSQASIRQNSGTGNTALAFQQSSNSRIGANGNNGITQNGDFNNSEVYQLAAGRSLQARSDQTGDNNDSVIIQSNNGGSGDMRARATQNGDGNISSVVQTGVRGATVFNSQMVDINQSGSDNLSRVEQNNQNSGADTSGFQLFQNDDGNDSFIIQDAGTARAQVTQNSTDTSGSVSGTAVANFFDGGTDDVRANFSRIQQTGSSRSDTTLTQTGFGNRSDIRQENTVGGFITTATVVQNGEGNNSDVGQTDFNTVFVDQIGDDNASLAIQSGDSNTGDINQTGNTGSSSLFQASANNQATLNQSNTDNESQIDQGLTAGSDGNMADVDQTGSNNDSFIQQGFGALGTNNDADVLQSGDDNFSSIVQEGNLNTADVTQATNGNTSFVTQTGSGGSVTVNQ